MNTRAVATWVRNIGLIVVAFVAYQLWWTGLGEHRAQATLAHEWVSELQAPASPTPPGHPVVHLQVAALHLDVYVVEGTGRRELEAGPGHVAGSALPGQPGNAIISGHRTTSGSPFAHLDRLRPGDVLTASTVGGTYRYRVTADPLVVAPSSPRLTATGAAPSVLTLVTCTPRYSAADRLVVTAALDSPPAVQAAFVRTAPAAQVVGGSGWQAGELPATAAVAAGLAALGVARGRLTDLWGRLGSAVVLAPVWCAGLLVLFEHARLLLPATL